MTSNTWSRLSTNSVTLGGNETVLLDGDRGDRSALFVESGSIALFGVDVRDGAPAGPRRMLHRIGSGQAVFRAPVDLEHRMRFVIVPIQDTVIREAPLAALLAEANGNEIVPLIDEWVDLVTHLAGEVPEPKLPVRVAGEREVDLEDGETLCAERKTVIWCRVLDGILHCRGDASAPIEKGSGWFPLGSGMWVRARGSVRVATKPTLALADAGDLSTGLGALHTVVLRELLAERDREAEAERVRLRQRDLIQEQRKVEALTDLASVLEPRVAPIAGDSPLLGAMTAACRTLGVQARRPMKSEAGGESVEAIARASRVRARQVTLNGKWWLRDCGSLVCYSADAERRPLALVRKGSFRYEVYDPVTGRHTRVDDRTAQGLSTDAWMLYRPLPEGTLNLWDLFRFSIGQRRKELALIMATGLAATLLGMITPQATALLMDHAIPDASTDLVIQIGAALLAAAFGQTVFWLSQGIVLMRLGLATGAETQAAVWDRLLRLRPSFFRRFSSGDLQSRVMSVSAVARDLTGVTLTSFFSGLLALLNLLLLYYYSPSLTLLAVVIGVVLALFTAVVGVLVRKNLRELLELDGKLFGIVVQLINGVGKLRVAGAGDRAYTHWLKKYATRLKLWSEAYRLQDRVRLFNQIVPALSMALLYLFAHELIVQGPTVQAGLTLGTFLAFSAAYGTFLAGAISLSDTAVRLLDVFATGRRVKPILEEEPEIDLTKADPGRLTGRLQLEGVDFRYRDDGPMTLSEVDLSAEPGEFIALVGPSGSGKSTTLKLLLGFESPDAGTVSYDGQDLANLDVVAVRRQIGVVLQGGRLDAGSIFENVACGDVISLDDAWAAIGDAGFGDEVRQMPMGIHTIISVGGTNLSGGQRQRLLIARALARRPRILLFDEATGALDNRTQAIVSDSLERLNVTRIVIAHRLSTIRNANRIYVLEDGRVVQHGRFDELMAEKGSVFARMMTRQMA